jgi:tetratricopeptide (TPR) repeat protein
MSDRKGTGLAILAGALIAGAVLAAYHNTFSSPFVFDAAAIIANNPTIRHLGSAFFPPHDGSTVDGRPLVNLSLAVNYAISGPGVWSYHAANLAIHILAAWTLFGIVRRTVRGGEGRAWAAGFAVALLWAVHPLQTESVTYVAQRAESLVGLCYLLTLYCFVRGAREARPFWLVLSVLACLAGTAAKEIIVSAPLLVLLYDSTFVAGSWREAWARRRGYYLALAATWIPLGCLVLGSATRNGTAGFGGDLRWSDYALTQVYAVVHYVRLAVWPSPLVFDYGTAVLGPGKLLRPALALLVLVGVTVAGLRARSTEGRTAGFLGAWFFAILAPTGLIPVATQTIAEHRMYLPLAALVAALVLALGQVITRPVLLAGLAGLAAAGLGAATFARNEVYGSELALWRDTAAKRPGNDRAHNNFGNALFALGQMPEAQAQYEEALRLHPRDNAEVQYNLGDVFLQEGRLPEAIAHGSEAVRLAPANADARNALGTALAQAGQLRAALEQFQAAAQLAPTRAEIHNNLGSAWSLLGQRAEAAAEYREALRLDPGYADARVALEHLNDAPAKSGAKP